MRRIFSSLSCSTLNFTNSNRAHQKKGNKLMINLQRASSSLSIRYKLFSHLHGYDDECVMMSENIIYHARKMLFL